MYWSTETFAHCHSGSPSTVTIGIPDGTICIASAAASTGAMKTRPAAPCWTSRSTIRRDAVGGVVPGDVPDRE